MARQRVRLVSSRAAGVKHRAGGRLDGAEVHRDVRVRALDLVVDVDRDDPAYAPVIPGAGPQLHGPAAVRAQHDRRDHLAAERTGREREAPRQVDAVAAALDVPEPEGDGRKAAGEVLEPWTGAAPARDRCREDVGPA